MLLLIMSKQMTVMKTEKNCCKQFTVGKEKSGKDTIRVSNVHKRWHGGILMKYKNWNRINAALLQKKGQHSERCVFYSN